MEGESLSVFPSSLTTFQQFKKSYPDGKLLAKPDRGNPGTGWESYFADSSALGLFGRLDSFTRLKGKDVVFGLRSNGKQVAIGKDYLSEKRLVVFEQFWPPVIVTCDSAANRVAAWALTGEPIDVSELKVANGKITVYGGRTVWDTETGRLLSGEGSDLTRRPVTSAFWFAWASFFPNTELVK